ncbi:MAG: helix-turn-helix domain-containing protein [Egibacteraceae bacterium]
MSQSPKELTPYASVQHFFGAELRRWRELRGLSQHTLGEQINFDGSLIGKVEKAERMPSRRLAEACDRVLETDGGLTRLWPLVERERERAAAGSEPEQTAGGLWPAPGMASLDLVVAPVLTPEGRVVLMPIDRRTLLLASGAAVVLPFVLPGVEWQRLVRALHAPERVDVEIVRYLQRVLDEHIVADERMGPHDLITVVAAQMGVIDRLRSGARGDVRDELLTVAARYAEFAGWLSQDAGDAQAARYWTDRAMERAQEAGNHVQVSHLLMRKSHQARDQRDAQGVIGLAQAAQQADGPLPPRIHAMAAEEEAQGHALAHEEVACHRKFDEALELVASGHPEGVPGPGQGRWCTEVYIELQRANGWLELGHPPRAIDLFERQLPKLPAVQQRDLGVYRARLARAYAANRDPEQAAAVGRQALAVGRDTGSARIFAELQRLDAALADYGDLPAVSEFHEALVPR